MHVAEARAQADASDQEEGALAALAAEALQGGAHVLLPGPEGAKQTRKKMMTPQEDALILRTWVR